MNQPKSGDIKETNHHWPFTLWWSDMASCQIPHFDEFPKQTILDGFSYDFPMTSSQFAEFSQGSRKLGDVPIVFPWFPMNSSSFHGASGPAPCDAALPLRSDRGGSAGDMAAGPSSKCWHRWDISPVTLMFFFWLKQLRFGYISSDFFLEGTQVSQVLYRLLPSGAIEHGWKIQH